MTGSIGQSFVRRSLARALTLGDDLLCTNPARIQKPLKEACDALLLKVNQIGTLTEALEATNRRGRGIGPSRLAFAAEKQKTIGRPTWQSGGGLISSRMDRFASPSDLPSTIACWKLQRTPDGASPIGRVMSEALWKLREDARKIIQAKPV